MAAESDIPCSADDGECENPAERDGLCWGHLRRREKEKGLGKLREELTPRDRLREAALAFKLASSADDADFKRRDDLLRKAAQRMGRADSSAAIRAGVQAAKRRGVHVGRPLALTPKQARQALAKHRTVAAAARALGVARQTFRQAMKRAGTKP